MNCLTHHILRYITFAVNLPSMHWFFHSPECSAFIFILLEPEWAAIGYLDFAENEVKCFLFCYLRLGCSSVSLAAA